MAAGLDAGADDYITKPVEVLELPARVRALLRRVTDVHDNQETEEFLAAGELRLNLTEFSVEANGETVPLSSTEYHLLYTLMSRAGQPQSVDQLLQDVWDYPPGVGDPDLVYAHIKNLRQKIEPDAQGPTRYLHTVRGRGYLIKPAVG